MKMKIRKITLIIIIMGNMVIMIRMKIVDVVRGKGHRPTRTHGLVRVGSGQGSILWTTVGHCPGSWSTRST